MAGVNATNFFPDGLSGALMSPSNMDKTPGVYDFAYGEYRSYSVYVQEMSNLQTQITNTGQIRTSSGLMVDSNSLGGMYALQIYIESLTFNKDTMSGLSKLGLANEKRLWQLQ